MSFIPLLFDYPAGCLGLMKAGHIREKLADISAYVETLFLAF
jgi:hypothetical protein